MMLHSLLVMLDIMDDELGLDYMKLHFEPFTRPQEVNGKRPPHLLLVDGHTSHINWHIVDFAINEGIHMVCLPSHSTYLLQPLDVSCFGLLTKNYNKALDAFHLKNGLWAEVKKPQFWELLKVSRKETFTPETIQAAWKKSGCCQTPAGFTIPKQAKIDFNRPRHTSKAKTFTRCCPRWLGKYSRYYSINRL